MPRLHLDRLECQTSVRDLRAALISLPTSVDETYNDAMTRIENQVPTYRVLAKSALSWISNALRPMYWDELRHALAIRRGDHSFNEEGLVDETLLISVSAGLITLDAQSETIRLAHFTVEEYFKRNKQTWFPNADTEIAETCLIYLSFDVFKFGPCSSRKELRIRLRQNCFLEYASQNWGYHAARADEHIDEDIAVHFLTNDQMVSCCSQARLYRPWSLMVFSLKRTRKQVQSSGLHLTAQLGLLSMFKRLLERGHQVDSKDYRGQTPLQLAVIKGHVEMVKFLMDQDDVIMDARDGTGRTPLSYAAQRGHMGIVELLAARDDVTADSWDDFGRTPLSYAAGSGCEAVVKLLFDRGVVADSRHNAGRTPLSYAAESGREAVVKLLLNRVEVVVDSRDNDGRTPLSYAAGSGCEAVVKLLLDRNDVVVDSRDKDGCTPLDYATTFRRQRVVQLLENKLRTSRMVDASEVKD